MFLLLLGVVAGVIAADVTELLPWLARRIVRWAARRWSPDPEVAAGLAEEWQALIEDRPIKLLKVATAVGFAGVAVTRATPRCMGRLVTVSKRWGNALPAAVRRLVASGAQLKVNATNLALQAAVTMLLAAVVTTVVVLASAEPALIPVILAALAMLATVSGLTAFLLASRPRALEEFCRVSQELARLQRSQHRKVEKHLRLMWVTRADDDHTTWLLIRREDRE